MALNLERQWVARVRPSKTALPDLDKYIELWKDFLNSPCQNLVAVVADFEPYVP